MELEQAFEAYGPAPPIGVIALVGGCGMGIPDQNSCAVPNKIQAPTTYGPATEVGGHWILEPRASHVVN